MVTILGKAETALASTRLAYLRYRKAVDGINGLSLGDTVEETQLNFKRLFQILALEPDLSYYLAVQFEDDKKALCAALAMCHTVDQRAELTNYLVELNKTNEKLGDLKRRLRTLTYK